MNLCACQIDIAWEDPAANFAKVKSLLAGETVEPDSLIVLPEMFSTGFAMNVPGAVRGAGEAGRFLRTLAAEKRSAVLAGVAAPGEAEGRGRNEAWAFDPRGKLIARYCKNRSFPLADESRHFEPGTEPACFDWGGFRVCPSICYDLRFPELFRRAVAGGAELFVVIANWPAERIEHWRVLLRARAIENQAWVAGVNRCGSDPQRFYPGQSLVIDPRGEIVGEAGDAECCLQAELDIASLRSWRMEFPALDDLEI